jgi:hypothetical protein
LASFIGTGWLQFFLRQRFKEKRAAACFFDFFLFLGTLGFLGALSGTRRGIGPAGIGPAGLVPLLKKRRSSWKA